MSGLRLPSPEDEPSRMVTPAAAHARGTPVHALTRSSAGNALSRTKTPEPRVLNKAGGAGFTTPAGPTGAASSAAVCREFGGSLTRGDSALLEAQAEMAVARPAQQGVSRLRWLAYAWLICCALDVAHLMPHPPHEVALGGDDLFLAMMGYPCHANVTMHITEARLQAQVVEREGLLQGLIEKKAEAVEDEDYQLAKQIKLEAMKLEPEVKESARHLAIYKNVSLEFLHVCRPTPSDSGAWVSKEIRHDLRHHLPTLPEAVLHALPSWALRDWYTERLQTAAERLHPYKSTCSKENNSECLSSSWAVLGQTSSCSLAQVTVRMRTEIKVDARLKGSVIFHVGLMVRDWYYYGFNVDLLKMKRSSMEKKDAKPTEEEVCEAVVDGSIRANKGVTKFAKELSVASIGYHLETLLIYLAVGISVALCIKLFRVVASKTKSD